MAETIAERSSAWQELKLIQAGVAVGNVVKHLVIPIRPSLYRSWSVSVAAYSMMGITRIANELLEAVMAADLTARQLRCARSGGDRAKLTGSGRGWTALPTTQIAADGWHSPYALLCKAKNDADCNEHHSFTNGRQSRDEYQVISDWNIEALTDSANH
ncbi:hypothetical protein AAHB58_09930 [Enterobacter hormaechei]